MRRALLALSAALQGLAACSATSRPVEVRIVEGLRSEKSDHQFRCSWCQKMQPAGSWMVYVPDSVLKGDPAWSIKDTLSRTRFNGSYSGWCVACAPKDPKGKTLAEAAPAPIPPEDLPTVVGRGIEESDSLTVIDGITLHFHSLSDMTRFSDGSGSGVGVGEKCTRCGWQFRHDGRGYMDDERRKTLFSHEEHCPKREAVAP